MRKLTTRILEAIAEMSGIIEADGYDQMQGYMTDSERNKAYTACLDAGSWAAEQVRKRAAKKKASK